MKQPSLFDEPRAALLLPGARTADRGTSHAAAFSMISAASSLRTAVLAEMRLHGPGTRDEIAHRMHMPPDKIWRRFSELKDLGLIEATDQTRLGDSGRHQSVWRVL